MNRNSIDSEIGYYLLTIRPTTRAYLLQSNNERALIISCLQDALTNRTFLDNLKPSTNFATYIDLLAFSILKEGVQCVVFAISNNSVRALSNLILSTLVNYQSENPTNIATLTSLSNPSVSIRQLIGPHDALHATTQLHLNHLDWEYDRYSSIGFFLHDRRGDWVRLWRLSHLYDNDASNYRRLLKISMQQHALHTPQDTATFQPSATSTHG